MDKNKIREIIRDELANLIKLDRYVFDKNIQVLDARNIQLGRTNGTEFGTASDQKLKFNCMLGFYNTTPVDQPETVADPTGGGDAGVDTPARTAIAAVIDRLQELGLIQ